ncbi:MAG TPA: hypothetical protein VGI39_38295, partial [Polyangiaceae bacterium]
MRLSCVGWVGCALLGAISGCANGSGGGAFGSDDSGTSGPTADAGGTTTVDATTPPPPPIEAGSPPDSGPPPSQTCVHNDDCAQGVVDLCTGNDGVACLGGFCVPTSKPMNCDDGIACTNDSCDATKNACVHVPDDANCPASSYCDPMLNCVAQLPCTPGDAVCDRLDTTACDGLWSCDGTKKYCVHAPKPCPDRPNASTQCATMPFDGGVPVPDDAGAGAQPADCGWTCASGYVDVNGDLGAAVGASSDGCECKVAETADGGVAYDPPDTGFLDTNCDGIDGTVSAAIFVDVQTGNDNNPGTMTLPVRTIYKGISLATNNGKSDVYVSKGTYPESVTMVDGVSVYGAYDASAKWSRGTGNVTTIQSPSPVGVAAINLSHATNLQLLTIVASDATGQAGNGDGESSVGVLIVKSGGNVTVDTCNITSGNGASGAKGADGSQGTGGSVGGGASGVGHGGPGGSACGAVGGQGGDGTNGRNNGGQGSNGTQTSGGGVPAAGGTGGGGGSCSATSASPGGSAPAVSTSGGQGGPGTNGSQGGQFGSLTQALPYYAPAAGGDGVSVGTAG